MELTNCIFEEGKYSTKKVEVDVCNGMVHYIMCYDFNNEYKEVNIYQDSTETLPIFTSGAQKSNEEIMKRLRYFIGEGKEEAKDYKTSLLYDCFEAKFYCTPPMMKLKGLAKEMFLSLIGNE